MRVAPAVLMSVTFGSLVTACAAKRAAAIAVPAITISPASRLAEADALVRAGCLDCLIAAYKSFDTLRAVPSVASPASARRR